MDTAMSHTRLSDEASFRVPHHKAGWRPPVFMSHGRRKLSRAGYDQNRCHWRIIGVFGNGHEAVVHGKSA
jgi:hypothetical protein